MEPPVALAKDSSSPKLVLKEMTLQELEDFCEQCGEKRTRALHIWRFMYRDGTWMRRFEDAAAANGKQNGFGGSFMRNVPHRATCSGGLHLQSVHTARDGTRKLLFATDDDGAAQVETVLIPVIREAVLLSFCMLLHHVHASNACAGPSVSLYAARSHDAGCDGRMVRVP